MIWLKKNFVVVPTDFSEESYAALAPALEFVENPNSLHVIHILPPLHPADPAAMWQTVNDQSREQHVQSFLQSKLSELGYEGIQVGMAVGDPSTEIVDYAKKNNADLIVMPSHGRTGVSHFLQGSVAERVVRLSHCPVLVMR